MAAAIAIPTCRLPIENQFLCSRVKSVAEETTLPIERNMLRPSVFDALYDFI